MACDIASPPHKGCADDIAINAYNFSEELLGFPYPIPAWHSIPIIFKQVKWSDIVHIHDCLYIVNILAFIASFLFSKPIVVTQHIGIVPYQEKIKVALQNIAYQLVGKIVLKHANKVVFINDRIRKWFESKLALQDTLLIPNGVDSKIFYPSNKNEKRLLRTKLGYSQDDFIVLFVGRFTQKKGVYLIRELADQRPNYQWLMIGRGEIDVLKWGLSNIKVFPPQLQTNLRIFYAMADIFFLPSIGEGFPLVVQEAMACGIPTAVSEETANSLTDAPLIKLDLTSLDHILKIVDEIAKIPDKTLQLRQDSEKFAKQWDWDITALKYEELFDKVIDNGQL